MSTTDRVAQRGHVMLNKVPEVTVYFWIIKILCTTVGESFADYINETLGFGLTNTTLLFSAALIAALVAQFRLNRYVPGVYWLSVVLISVVGTLLTDNLTDGHNVPLWISTTVFSVLLAVVFYAIGQGIRDQPFIHHAQALRHVARAGHPLPAIAPKLIQSMIEIDAVTAEPAFGQDGRDLGRLISHAEARGVDDHPRQPRRQRQRAQALAFRGDAAVAIERVKLGQQAFGFLPGRCGRWI